MEKKDLRIPPDLDEWYLSHCWTEDYWRELPPNWDSMKKDELKLYPITREIVAWKASKAKKNKSKKILVAFLLDETGSMLECKDAVHSGFDEYVNSLKAMVTDKCKISFRLLKFNSFSLPNGVVHAFHNVSSVPPLKDFAYRPEHVTPLYDAIAKLIVNVKASIANTKRKPDVLFVIQTDGLENASRHYKRDDIFRMIEAATEEGWTFVYLGANQDAWKVGLSIGVQSGNTISYASTDVGTRDVFSRVKEGTRSFLDGGDTKSTSFFTKK